MKESKLDIVNKLNDIKLEVEELIMHIEGLEYANKNLISQKSELYQFIKSKQELVESDESITFSVADFKRITDKYKGYYPEIRSKENEKLKVNTKPCICGLNYPAKCNFCERYDNE